MDLKASERKLGIDAQGQVYGQSLSALAQQINSTSLSSFPNSTEGKLDLLAAMQRPDPHRPPIGAVSAYNVPKPTDTSMSSSHFDIDAAGNISVPAGSPHAEMFRKAREAGIAIRLEMDGSRSDVKISLTHRDGRKELITAPIFGGEPMSAERIAKKIGEMLGQNQFSGGVAQTPNHQLMASPAEILSALSLNQVGSPTHLQPFSSPPTYLLTNNSTSPVILVFFAPSTGVATISSVSSGSTGLFTAPANGANGLWVMLGNRQADPRSDPKQVILNVR